MQRYNSWYRFDMHEHSAGNGGTEGNVCHYHYYTLQVFSQILADIKKEPYASDPDFAALYNKLLYNWAGGAAARCDDSGLPASKKSMRGHPLAELYYGGTVYHPSSFPHGACNDARFFQRPNHYTSHPPEGPHSDHADSVIATRRFFDDVYAGCRF